MTSSLIIVRKEKDILDSDLMQSTTIFYLSAKGLEDFCKFFFLFP